MDGELAAALHDARAVECLFALHDAVRDPRPAESRAEGEEQGGGGEGQEGSFRLSSGSDGFDGDPRAASACLWLLASAAARCGGWVLQLGLQAHEECLFRALQSGVRDERLCSLAALRAATARGIA
jgi:hypothetical protein